MNEKSLEDLGDFFTEKRIQPTSARSIMIIKNGIKYQLPIR
jgi:hypothetical protein